MACGSALTVVFVAVVARARYGHPLRFYITPHCPQCPRVAALTLRLLPATASLPPGLGEKRQFFGSLQGGQGECQPSCDFADKGLASQVIGWFEHAVSDALLTR